MKNNVFTDFPPYLRLLNTPTFQRFPPAVMLQACLRQMNTRWEEIELYHGNSEYSPVNCEAVDTIRCEVNDKLNFKIYSMYIMNCSSVLHCIYIKNKISNREEVKKFIRKLIKLFLTKFTEQWLSILISKHKVL